MQIKNTALRLAGAAMITLAVTPWIGGTSASAVTRADADIFLKESQQNSNPATDQGIERKTDCPGYVSGAPFDYFHFVLDGNAHDFVEVTAEFSTGNVTLVVDPQSKHAYMRAPAGSVLLDAYADVTPDDASIPGDFQLSHVCLGTPGESTTPTTVTTTPTTVTTTPTTVTTTPTTVTTTPTTVTQSTAQQSVSVLPTKVENKPATESDDTEVLAAEAGQLPHTGAGLPVGVLLMVSLGLLLGGGALMLLPGLAFARGQHRRH
jgi:hypothetical protein